MKILEIIFNYTHTHIYIFNIYLSSTKHAGHHEDYKTN